MPGFDWLHSLVGEYTGLRDTWGVALDLAIIAGATLVVDLVTRGLFYWLHKRVSHTHNLWDDAFYYSLNGPLQTALWVSAAVIAIHLDTPADAAWRVYVSPLSAAAYILIAIWFLFSLTASIENNAVARGVRRDKTLDATTVDAVGKLARAVVLIAAALILLDTWGVAPSGLLAFSGIGGIAVGFAARDVLANIFGGVTIYLNRPFSVGEWIRSPDREIEGVVEAIGWRATTVRRFDKRPLYVPNAVFSNVALENPSRMTHRQISETLGVRYEDAAAVPDIVAAIRDMLEADEGVDDNEVILTYLDTLGESSLRLLIYCYTYTTDWAKYLAIKQSVLQRAQDIVRAHGAAVALPERTLHVPGELLLARAHRGEASGQEEIDTDKVASERRESLAREQRDPKARVGPDNPAEEGQS